MNVTAVESTTLATVAYDEARESDTPRGAGGLMSWTASKAVGHGFKASR